MCDFISCFSQRTHTLTSFLAIPFFQGIVNVLVYNMNGDGVLEEDCAHHCISFHLRVDDTRGETFYFLDGAEGSSIFRVQSRERLWQLFSTTNGRAQVLDIIGRPFGRAAFNTNNNGEPENVLVIPRVFIEPVNRRYDALDGLTIEDCRNSGLSVCHGVISKDEAIPRDPPFAMSFVRANDPSILTL